MHNGLQDGKYYPPFSSVYKHPYFVVDWFTSTVVRFPQDWITFYEIQLTWGELFNVNFCIFPLSWNWIRNCYKNSAIFYWANLKELLWQSFLITFCWLLFFYRKQRNEIFCGCAGNLHIWFHSASIHWCWHLRKNGIYCLFHS